MDPIPAEPMNFEPLEEELPNTSAQASEEAKEQGIDYTIATEPSTADPMETNLEQEMKQNIQGEVDERAIKSCMECELKILHSACIHYLTIEDIHKDYHMPTLVYPLLEQEVQLLKQKNLPECPTNELGGYEQVPIQDFQVAEI